MNFQPLYPYREEITGGPELRDERLAPFPRTGYAVKVNRQEYYAIIMHMDEQIGIILDKLEESGDAENTYIFFTSDHGLAVGEHGLLGKQNMYDRTTRGPFHWSADLQVQAKHYLRLYSSRNIFFVIPAKEPFKRKNFYISIIFA